VRLSGSVEDMEGSFDNDVLIGNAAPNSILGQPGVDRIYGGGGGDVLDARDGVRDEVIQCSPGQATIRGSGIRARSGGAAFVDAFDPAPVGCAEVVFGHPVPGLGKTGEHHPSR
jgi:Ca2+-binding RTX toxin-like protein